jgi:hypothetical protein
VDNPSVCRNARIRIAFVSPPRIVCYSGLVETCESGMQKEESCEHCISRKIPAKTFNKAAMNFMTWQREGTLTRQKEKNP